MRPLLLGLSLVWLAVAQPAPVAAQAAAAAKPADGVQIVQLQDLPSADSLGEWSERLWSDFLGMFRLGQGHSQFARRTPEVESTHARARDDFGALMEMAGYKLKEIESYVGVIPSLQMTFGQARELTEADREYVERQLLRHSRRHPGPLAAIQRMIVRSVVEAADIGGYSVDKVAVDIFPLPKVKFVLTPADAPLSLDAARIMRAIDGLNRKLEQMPAPRTGS
ncbi:hypothetical protein EDC65_1557 [Stella humosa]|uniref:Uncharacterized protein n=1 Tax=Stella humosa TaxID=94 RepID=A0A3N1MAJ1_9PROT|nr:hypothetical protein [Stella humosa]ROP99769.1 hypothetical protein EDC65_1557 [Stella humosa]BBK31004.1 hypothetical protein STHU_16380 [Stella humosa]